MPVPRRVYIDIQIVKRSATPQSALYSELLPIVVYGHGIGGLGLQFHRICANAIRCFLDGQCAFETTIMVTQKFGDDVGPMARPDLPIRDGKHLIRHLSSRLIFLCSGDIGIRGSRRMPDKPSCQLHVID